MKKILPIILLLFVFQSYGQNHTITLKVFNVPENVGRIQAYVYNVNSDFLESSTAVKSIQIKANSSTVQSKITVPAGTYAIALFHDKNEDMECNRNFMGLPLEHYGFSNNVEPKISKPKFNQCSFKTEPGKVVGIRLIK